MGGVWKLWLLSSVFGIAMAVGCSGAGDSGHEDVGTGHDAADASDVQVDQDVPAILDARDDVPYDAAADLSEVGTPDVVHDDVPGDVSPPVSPNRLDDVEYLVIAADDLAGAFQPLVEWKRTLGLSARVVTVAEIIEATTPVGSSEAPDVAAGIRMYLKVLHETTGLRYVLLGGDHPQVPRREIWASADVPAESTFVEDWVASDLYYADLDGDWDGDGDGTLAELEDGLDLLPDLLVGRLPVDTADEVAIYLEKLVAWDTATNTDYQDRLLFLGEWVASDPMFGDLYASTAFEGLLAPLVPDSVRLTRLYDDYETVPGSLPNNADNLRTAFADGHALAINMGHGNIDTLASLRSPDLNDLAYTGRPPVYWTTECYSGMFDTEPGECAAETFLRVRGGGVAYVGNSDFGIGMPSIMNLFEALLRGLYTGKAETLGELMAWGLENYTNRDALDSKDGPDRFTNLTLLTLGDPSIRMWTGPAMSAELTVSGGGRERQISVVAGGQPVSGAIVAVYVPGAALYTATTGDDGLVDFLFPETPAQDWKVTVSGHNLPAMTLDKPL